jgi:transcriptional regulator with XRE-family HTH domain
VSRAEEVRELRGQGRSTRQIAAKLGLSQTRVCQLLNSTQPAAPPDTVQPAGDSPLNTTHPNTVQPLDEAAIRADERARATARIRPHWDAAQAEIASLRARVAELEAGAPGPGSCPSHRVPLVAACPRCTPLED